MNTNLLSTEQIVTIALSKAVKEADYEYIHINIDY